MLSIRNLQIEYDSKVIVRNLTLQVADGEVVCLRGESGCGKTSILRAILGFIDYQGTIMLDSNLLTPGNISAMRQQMAYVPQDTLMPYDTVRDMIQGILSLRANTTTPWDSYRIKYEWIDLDLDDSLYESPLSQLSGGQRQRPVEKTPLARRAHLGTRRPHSLPRSRIPPPPCPATKHTYLSRIPLRHLCPAVQQNNRYPITDNQ